ncbi:YidB family protein [Streptomyces mirabilis]|uniref:YidB family protein n=2 Tax=Streptomyces mirabilis TaxID=68239 RepID=UPI00367674A8
MAGDDLGCLLGGLLGGGGRGGSGGIGGSGGTGAGNILGALLGALGGGGGQAAGGKALPDNTLQEVAAQAGVSPQEAADQIAQHLPQAVDKLTPTGELPQPGASLEDLIKQQSL